MRIASATRCADTETSSDAAEVSSVEALTSSTEALFSSLTVAQNIFLGHELRRGWRLDDAAMHAAAQRLVGRHDFTTFRSVHCQAQSPEKTLDLLSVERVGEEVHIRAAARSLEKLSCRRMIS